MANELEIKRKSRKVQRALFTRVFNDLNVLLTVERPVLDNIKITFELLTSKYDDLRMLDNEIYGIILEDASEKELEDEMITCDSYKVKYSGSKLQYRKMCEDEDAENIERRSESGRGSSVEENQGRRKFKLPHIQFKHYDGSVKDWLAFWAQFKKIHEDSTIDDHDKIEYLIQATLPGSRARRLVESYPAMEENYSKIIDSMQSRFGREDLQIEVYVRELLRLILTNSVSKESLDIATLYDKIETQLRALETLGISSDKCSAMLFPLIESCLPQELLRAWQRSAFFNNSSESEEVSASHSSTSPHPPLEQRLKNLMRFLRSEVENEQRIALAVEGFGLQEHNSSVKSTGVIKPKNLQDKSSNLPTAMGLVNSDGAIAAICVFCMGSHNSDACYKAQRMSYSQKRDLLSGKKACFRCLKPGHTSKKCRGRMRCMVCTRMHVSLMCPDLPVNKDVPKLPDKRNRTNNNQEGHEDPVKNQALANQTGMHVFLQTLRVTIHGPQSVKTVRALIDTGSQRSYVLTDTATQLGLQSKRQEKMVHCLFGGAEQTSSHQCYDVTISNGQYLYNFEVLSQPIICGNVVPVFYGPWVEQMNTLDLKISDFGSPGHIELLLGADVVGRLYTGGCRELPCGLMAVETLVGWTLMGKIPTNGQRSDLVMTTLNLFVNNASLSDMGT